MLELKPKKMIDAYKKSFKKFGVSPSSLLIPKGRQEIRFNSFLPYIKNNSTLLDFGCGFSDLADFFKKKQLKIDYYGCDIIDEFLNISKNKHPNFTFFKDLSCVEIKNKTFDTIVCAGAFNFLYCNNEKEHFDHIKNILLKLFSMTNINLVIDFQTEFVDFKTHDSYHQKIDDIVDFIYKNLSRRFSIDHSYLPYEYNVNIMKESEILKQLNVYKK